MLCKYSYFSIYRPLNLALNQWFLTLPIYNKPQKPGDSVGRQ